jgi:chromosome segregation ATPase
VDSIEATQLQQPIATILNAEEAQARLDETNAHVELLKSELRRVEDAPYGSELDQDQVDLLKRSEEAAKAELEKLNGRCDELQHQKDLIAQWDKRRNEVEGQVNNLANDVSAFVDKYNAPNPLITAEDDLRRSESLKNRLGDSMGAASSLQAWLGEQMPSNEPGNDALQQHINNLEQLDAQLTQLRQPLMAEVSHEKQLLDEQKAILEQLARLEDEALRATEGPEPALALEELHQLHLYPVREQLEKLENEAALPNQLVHHGDLLNLPLVRERLEGLEHLLDQKAEDAAAKMAFMRLAGNISKETAELRENVQRAQRIEDDPNASLAELETAIDLLNTSRAQLNVLEDLYNQLDPNNEQANALRTQAVADQSALGEALNNTSQALQDRLDTLRRFNDDANAVEARLRQLKDQVENVEPARGETAKQTLDSMNAEEAGLREKISAMEPAISALTPLIQPASRHEELQRLAQELRDQLDRANNAVDAAIRKQDAITNYANELARLEDTLRGIERDTDAAQSTTEALSPLMERLNANLWEPIKRLDEQEAAPTDELKERKARLKERTRDLNQRLAVSLLKIYKKSYKKIYKKI